MGVIADQGLTVEERPFNLEDVKSAREAFITGAGALVMPVVRVDGQPIGDGAVGPVAKKLRAAYIERAQATSK